RGRAGGEGSGCGATPAALGRTRVGPFRLEDAVMPERLTAGDLRDPATLVAELPRRDLDEAGQAAVMHGRPIGRGPGPGTRDPVALFADGKLIAVAEEVGDMLKPRVVVVDE